MFAIYSNEERCEVFLHLENAKKCLCLNYENESVYSIKELQEDEDLEDIKSDDEAEDIESDDEAYEDIPYIVYAVKVDGDIKAAFSDEEDADNYAGDLHERDKAITMEDWGIDEDDLSPKRASEISMQLSNIKVKKYKPKDGENYRDCIEILDKTLDFDEDYFDI